MVAHPLAGPSRRLVAYLVDQILIGLVTTVISILSMIAAPRLPPPAWAALVAFFVLSWGYGAFCEGVFNGQTVGKRVLGIRVVSDRGVPISGAQAVLRNLVGTVDGLAFFFQLGLASMILSGKFQRLGDLAAGTMVVIEERRAGAASSGFSIRRSIPSCAWLPGRIPAGSDLARVLSDYVGVRNRFTPARRAEMAEPLARPLKKRFGLSAAVPADVVLCAVYHRVFVGE